MVVVMFVLFFFTRLFGQCYTKYLFNEVKDNNKVFVYETYTGALNPVLYVTDLQDTSELIAYYDKIAKHDMANAFFNFRINFMPTTLYQPIYTGKSMGKASKIVEVIDFNTKCWGYIRGYICLSTTHKIAPSYRLVKVYKNRITETPSSDRIHKKTNPYGWYCDN